MDGTNPLGEYLKARRQLVTPEQVGLPRGPRRRVPGLRREELALLAGISPDYYLRLEQGRDHNPSAQVLDALARVLHLDREGTAYLQQLGRAAPAVLRAPGTATRTTRTTPRTATTPGPTTTAPTTAAPTTLEDRVDPAIVQLIDELPVPTFVQGRWLDVLAANPLARALSPQYRPGVNLLRAAFTDPRDRTLHQDWDRATEEAVSGLRAAAGTDLDDPRLQDLVAELSAVSDRFRELWARHDVRGKVGGTSVMLHPEVGPLELRHEKFAVTGSTGQLMVVYHAEPGSPSHDALRRLAASIEQAGAAPTGAIPPGAAVAPAPPTPGLAPAPAPTGPPVGGHDRGKLSDTR
ncbi:helix-turn-helix transcriptional regulator [Curtobacterium sp. ISL-83]|uniref:helix-turn-helix domain-containing protein n=1 Tax=Curtobacterium sp. ISL-83 TaxID=2819145 RepID=UPI0027DFA3B7|nr:helix-turn-helix transcriptional regulator [Curtobacterium sp. ISL-83]